MFIQVVSDLHLEAQPYTLKINPKAEVLVIAGDTCPVGFIGRYMNLIKPIDIPIIAILGNHEYYCKNAFPLMNRETVIKNFKDLSINKPNFHLLDNEFFDINGVRFLGTTLWSDLESRNSRQMPFDLLRNYIFQNISDFHDSPEWSVNKMIDYQKSCVQFIQKSKSNTLKNVVVSHFVPIKDATHPKYTGQLLNCYFINDLEYMIDDSNIHTWIFGHTHSPWNFMKYDTHMVCNPRGYCSNYYKENDDFDSQLLIEV